MSEYCLGDKRRRGGMKSLYFDSFKTSYSHGRSNLFSFFDLVLLNPTSNTRLAPLLARNTFSSCVVPLRRVTVNVDLRTSKWGTTVPWFSSFGTVAWHSSTLSAASRCVLRPLDIGRYKHRGGDKRGKSANEVFDEYYRFV